jgi:NAD(P)H-dependent flavin oxidoreductase YrpB (nitropropane dioxygenase family)
LRTGLCELLGIDAPVLGAPMGPEIAGLELAAAVSNAGGLGIISFGGYPPAVLRERIRTLRTLTSGPFGVNVLLDSARGREIPGFSRAITAKYGRVRLACSDADSRSGARYRCFPVHPTNPEA